MECQKYKLLSIETTGSYLEIEEDPTAELSEKLVLGKKRPIFHT